MEGRITLTLREPSGCHSYCSTLHHNDTITCHNDLINGTEYQRRYTIGCTALYLPVCSV